MHSQHVAAYMQPRISEALLTGMRMGDPVHWLVVHCNLSNKNVVPAESAMAQLSTLGVAHSTATKKGEPAIATSEPRSGSYCLTAMVCTPGRMHRYRTV